MSTPQKQVIFTEAYNNPASTAIPFDEKWSNGTGYFDNAVYGSTAPKVPFGSIYKSVTPGNRRILIIGTRLGNVVVFDRYQNSEKDVFVYNSTHVFAKSQWLRGNSLDDDDMGVLLGFDQTDENIGKRIDNIYSFCKKRDDNQVAATGRRD